MTKKQLADLNDTLYSLYYTVANIRDGEQDDNFLGKLDSTIEDIKQRGFILKTNPKYSQADAAVINVLDCLTTIDTTKAWRRLELLLLLAGQSLSFFTLADNKDRLADNAVITISIERTITITGLNPFFINGENQWNLFKDLITAHKSDEFLRGNKNSVDTFRRTLQKQYGNSIGNEVFSKIIIPVKNHGYRLGKVTLLGFSGLCIKRTIQKSDPYNPRPRATD